MNGACSIHVHLVVAGTFNTKHSVMLAWVRIGFIGSIKSNVDTLLFVRFTCAISALS